MIHTVKSGASLGDPDDERRSPRPRPEGQAAPAEETKGGASQPDVRLLIEEDGAGALIYKLIDRATGNVVSEVSRDDLVKMGADPLYTAGRVIDTKA